MNAGDAPVPAGFRLPAWRRLKGADEFDRVFRAGVRRTGRFFVLHAAPFEDGPGRLGLVVAKRVTGNNVLRNRVKRLIREAFRHSSLRLGRTDVVVRLRIKPDVLQWAQAKNELLRLLEELA
ncbi:MAG: ribonuclease P protein component [Burkholderiales bacterium]